MSVSGNQAKRKDRPGVDRMGRTDLHYAAAEGDVGRLRTRLAGGASPTLADDNGWTPLHFSAQAQNPEIATLLLDAGAPVDAPDSHGNTALSRAVFESKGQGDLIRLLRARGADPRRPNSHGISPLSLARTIANYDVAQFFADIPR